LHVVDIDTPAAKHARLFVQVADENALDWTLLPTIAFLESGGGKIYANNNIFGWDSGKQRFKSVEDGIKYVAAALTKGSYRGKTTSQKIRTYNVYGRYHYLAKVVMQWISSTP
jgi:hypothetical protein